ncbi:MAG TPA: ParB/RepB/Spo0J family partition protein [Caproicibacter sp.]|nr:ParB/RepB/Spo0J family partition protein [Caproicibacter sp.]
MQPQMIPTLEEAMSGTLFGSVKPDDKKVVMLDPSELIEIEDQPFRPYPPDKLAELADDIKENGQINPCTVRKKDGKYIVLAGRNRKRACELAGLKVSCILIECDDATANLVLVNSNLNQRQELLPSEKAFAYKLQKESYEAKGQKKTEAAVAEQNSENVKKIQRYIKLTKLPKDLLDMVDSGRLPITVGVEFAYMPKVDMETISLYLANHEQLSVSVDQAQQIRKLSPDLSVTELDHLFLFDGATNTDPDSDESPDKKEKAPKKAVTSVSIKIEELEPLNCNFDFANAKKAEIREFIINSLEEYFGSVYDC